MPSKGRQCVCACVRAWASEGKEISSPLLYIKLGNHLSEGLINEQEKGKASARQPSSVFFLSFRFQRHRCLTKIDSNLMLLLLFFVGAQKTNSPRCQAAVSIWICDIMCVRSPFSSQLLYIKCVRLDFPSRTWVFLLRPSESLGLG